MQSAVVSISLSAEIKQASHHAWAKQVFIEWGQALLRPTADKGMLVSWAETCIESNWVAQRCPKDAKPHLCRLQQLMTAYTVDRNTSASDPLSSALRVCTSIWLLQTVFASVYGPCFAYLSIERFLFTCHFSWSWRHATVDIFWRNVVSMMWDTV